ncbi:MAG: amino acid ABC transporter permease [Chloroflexi bacterium]|nr:amino acid ABC transporter permease [Chloroflexota bacterium]
MSLGRRAWLRQNLFNSWWSSVVTVALGALLLWATVRIGAWAISEARWGVVTANLRLFLVGLYPADQVWRVWLGLTGLSVLGGVAAAVYRGGAVRTLAFWLAASQVLLAGLAAVSELGLVAALALLLNVGATWAAWAAARRLPIAGRALAAAWLVYLVLALILLAGVGGPLPVVGTNVWGGLLLTFLLAVAGIILSFPIGVLLALGRRSDLPAVRVFSTAFIEVVRGVPLVTILFMAAIMLPLFLPGEIRVEHVIRATAGITLFSAAYVAENVRGGLQAIPSGQYEAAHAIGLNAVQTNLHIILPQALRSVIPANVGLFISLLKDTTLVTIGAGLLEILGIGRAVLAQPEWFGAQMEVYLFIAAVFFVLSYTLSQASYRLEAALGVGKR